MLPRVGIDGQKDRSLAVFVFSWDENAFGIMDLRSVIIHIVVFVCQQEQLRAPQNLALSFQPGFAKLIATLEATDL